MPIVIKQQVRFKGISAAELFDIYTDPDSIVTLVFTPTEAGGRIDLCHANVPARLIRNTGDGWRAMYWRPWRDYVRKRRGRPQHDPT